jgi:hypothetical protein
VITVDTGSDNMSKELLIEQLAGLSEEEMAEVLKFVRLLQRQPEKLSAAELTEVREGQEELRRGEWARWQDVKRDV